MNIWVTLAIVSKEYGERRWADFYPHVCVRLFLDGYLGAQWVSVLKYCVLVGELAQFILLFQMAQIQIPAPTSASSQQPITPTPEDRTPSPGSRDICTHTPTFMYRYTCRCTKKYPALELFSKGIMELNISKASEEGFL